MQSKLKLLRYRRNDPIVEAKRRDAATAGGSQAGLIDGLIGHSAPGLEVEPGVPDDVAFVDLPQFRVRRKHTAQDPLAVVQAFAVHLRIILPRLCGFRMCPNCPHCNAEGSKRPCQDMFGSNMRPMGGIVGAVEACGGAGEHQRQGTPHLHSFVDVASAFQHKTMT